MTRPIRLIRLLAIVGSFAVSQQAVATYCVVDLTMGTQILSATSGTIPSQITSAHQATVSSINTSIQTMQQAIAQQLGNVGSVLKGTMQATSEAEVQTMRVNNTNLMTLLTRLAAAQAAADNRRQFGASEPFTGPDGREYRSTATPASTCRRALTARTRARSDAERAQASGATSDRVAYYRGSGMTPTESSTRLRTLRERAPEAYEPHAYPGYNSSPEDYDADMRAEYMVSLIDPEPFPEITTDSSSSVEALEYDAMRELYYAKTAPFEHTLLNIASSTAYEIDDPQTSDPEGNYQTRWAAIHQGAPMEPVATADGKISFNNILKVEVMDRVGNRRWFEEEQQKLSTNGLLKELLQMDAIRMQMEFETYKLTQQIAWMMAQEGIERARAEHGPIVEQLLTQQDLQEE